jgi:hypothetical protein
MCTGLLVAFGRKPARRTESARLFRQTCGPRNQAGVGSAAPNLGMRQAGSAKYKLESLGNRHLI